MVYCTDFPVSRKCTAGLVFFASTDPPVRLVPFRKKIWRRNPAWIRVFSVALARAIGEQRCLTRECHRTICFDIIANERMAWNGNRDSRNASYTPSLDSILCENSMENGGRASRGKIARTVTTVHDVNTVISAAAKVVVNAILTQRRRNRGITGKGPDVSAFSNS